MGYGNLPVVLTVGELLQQLIAARLGHRNGSSVAQRRIGVAATVSVRFVRVGDEHLTDGRRIWRAVGAVQILLTGLLGAANLAHAGRKVLDGSCEGLGSDVACVKAGECDVP